MIRNRYNQVPYLTQTVWKNKKHTRNHQLQESQEIRSFPTGDHKAARNRHDSMAKIDTNNTTIHKKTTALKRSVRKY